MCVVRMLFEVSSVQLLRTLSRQRGGITVCAVDASLPLILSLLLQVDAADYDNRAALHIAACESNLSAVRASLAVEPQFSLLQAQ